MTKRGRPDVPFEPKAGAPGSTIEWWTPTGDAVRSGQVWAAAPPESGHPATWVVPHDGADLAVLVVRVRKGGRYRAGWRWAPVGPTWTGGDHVEARTWGAGALTGREGIAA